MTQWSLEVSDKTDEALRSFLAGSDEQTDDMSAFVEKAVSREMFRQTINRLKERNAQYDQQEIMDTIDEAVAWARANRS